jgi:hypothetical protein
MIHKLLESVIFYFLPLLLQIYCYTRISHRLFYVDETLQTSFHTVGKLTFQRTTQVYLLEKLFFFFNNKNYFKGRY